MFNFMFHVLSFFQKDVICDANIWNLIDHWLGKHWLFPLSEFGNMLKKIGFKLPIYLRETNDYGKFACQCSDGSVLIFRFNQETHGCHELVVIKGDEECYYDYAMNCFMRIVRRDGKKIRYELKRVECSIGEYEIVIKHGLRIGNEMRRIEGFLFKTSIPVAQDIWDKCIKRFSKAKEDFVDIQVFRVCSMIGEDVTSKNLISRICIKNGEIRVFIVSEGDIVYGVYDNRDGIYDDKYPKKTGWFYNCPGINLLDNGECIWVCTSFRSIPIDQFVEKFHKIMEDARQKRIRLEEKLN